MDNKYFWTHYIWIYFDILKEINISYKKLLNKCKIGNHFRVIENLYYDIFYKMMQLIPSKFVNNQIQLKDDNGVLELINGDIPFVKETLNNIIINYNKELSSIRNIRNNIEHSPHKTILFQQINGMGNSTINVKYYGRDSNIKNIEYSKLINCYCSTNILRNIIFELNKLFESIKKYIYELYKNGYIDEKTSNYYKKYHFKNISEA